MHCKSQVRHFRVTEISALLSMLTLAQLLGHSSTAILPTYAKALDENTRAVITRLDEQRLELSQPQVVQ